MYKLQGLCMGECFPDLTTLFFQNFTGGLYASLFMFGHNRFKKNQSARDDEKSQAHIQISDRNDIAVGY